MAQVKDRKVLAIDNFRGLDTENKKIKVAPYRASEGHNFILDSDTLKTRPGFKFLTKPFFDNAKIIDFYFFRDNVVLYITENGFRVKRNGILQEGVYFDNFVADNFSLSDSPIFQEEKDVLFIFGLNGCIYIFGNVYNENGTWKKSFVYELRNRPVGKEYKDFPEAYVPTIFIGSERFEDVNLLSNKSKYEMFLSGKEKETFFLPTHYNKEKNGEIESDNWSVDIFDGKYNSLFLPKYLGKVKEDIEEANKSLLKNDDDPIIVSDESIFNIDNEWISKHDGNRYVLQGGKAGLTRDKFFGMKTNEGITTYEKMLMLTQDLINTNSLTNNFIYKFSVPIMVNVKYYDEHDNLVETKKERQTIAIYAQIAAKTTRGNISIINDSVYTLGESTINKYSNVFDFPEYTTNGGEITDLGVANFNGITLDNSSVSGYIERKLSQRLEKYRDGLETENYKGVYKVACKDGKTFYRNELGKNTITYNEEKKGSILLNVSDEYPTLPEEYQNNYDLGNFSVHKTRNNITARNIKTIVGEKKTESPTISFIEPNVDLSGRVNFHPDNLNWPWQYNLNTKFEEMFTDSFNREKTKYQNGKHYYKRKFTKRYDDISITSVKNIKNTIEQSLKESKGVFLVNGPYQKDTDHFLMNKGFENGKYIDIGKMLDEAWDRNYFSTQKLKIDYAFNQICYWLNDPSNINTIRDYAKKYTNGGDGTFYFKLRMKQNIVPYSLGNSSKEFWYYTFYCGVNVELNSGPRYDTQVFYKLFDIVDDKSLPNGFRIDEIIPQINNKINILLTSFYDTSFRDLIFEKGTFNQITKKWEYTLNYKAKVKTIYNDIPSNYVIAGSIPIVLEEYNKYNSAVLVFELKGNDIDFHTKEDLYNLRYSEKHNSFLFDVPYIYNFQDKQTISLEVMFKHNPDYKLIANSKIGTTFGSENRLFLAGNKDYQNIDRYNVSNDLLGGNKKSQSYELSYFPSKNYRVVGGNGAINGYVLAGDNNMYITKKEFPNDDKVFIRERVVSEKGVVGYNDIKTNIDITPINDKSIVRFNNDVVLLDKSGLYAIQLAQNIQTNERHKNNRSSFINKEIVNAIKNSEKVFIFEDNDYMYIFIGDVIYVADTRYTAQNKNGEQDNYSYEFVKWLSNVSFSLVKKIKGNVYMLDKNRQYIYSLEQDKGFDEIIDSVNNNIFSADFTFSIDNNSHIDLVDNYFIIPDLYKLVEQDNFIVNGNTIEIINDKDFTSQNEDVIVYMFKNGVFTRFKGFFNTDRTNIVFDTEIPINSDLYIDMSDKPLYVSDIKNTNTHKEFLLSEIEQEINYTNDLIVKEKFLYMGEGLITAIGIKKIPIDVLWQSGVLDFGNDLMEKTMFRTNIYSTRTEGSKVSFGYRTMRSIGKQERDYIVGSSNNLNNVDFNLYALSTFNEMGQSIPMKENNFLYMQFKIKGTGNIEVNGIKVIYKYNRMLKIG